MAAFRPINPMMVWLDNLGVVLNGGYFLFYDTGTLEAKSVFAEEALSTDLGNSITLDSAGRLPSEIWGSGIYRIRLYDADDVLIDEADPVQEQGAASSAIPSQTGNSGEFLTTNGTVMSWAAIRQVPDPTGQSGKYLTTDGSTQSWATITIPTLPTDGITDATSSDRIGDSLYQFGSGTAPASGTHTTSVAIVFATPYASTPKVFITPLENSITPNGYAPVYAVKSLTTTGCTVHFDVNSDLSGASYNIDTTIPFDYMVRGRI